MNPCDWVDPTSFVLAVLAITVGIAVLVFRSLRRKA